MKIEEQIAQYQGGKLLGNLTPERVLDFAAELQLDKIKGIALTSPAMTMDFLSTQLKSKKTEIFHVIFLDTRHRVIESKDIFQGSIDGACVYPRVVAEMALRLHAAAIICAHNHPSGTPEPSLADQAITRRLKDALALLEIRLLDHFVVGDGDPVSMASRGMM
jgi:DNA repair protein RadC